MRKKLKKLMIIFLACTVFTFGVVPKQENHQAEASASAALGGFTTGAASLGSMAALFPAIVPTLAIGLFSVMFVGLTYSNWDQIYAFGLAVVHELGALGHTAGEFVTGTTVSVNGTLRKAIYKAADSMKAKTTVDSNYTGYGNILETIPQNDSLNNDFNLYRYEHFEVGLAGIKPGSTWQVVGAATKYSFGKNLSVQTQKTIDNLRPHMLEKLVYIRPFSVSVRFKPMTDCPIVEPTNWSGIRHLSTTTYIQNASGQYIGANTQIHAARYDDTKFSGIYVRNFTDENVILTSVDIPAFGIGSKATITTNTGSLVNSGYGAKERDKIADVVFPPSPGVSKEQVTFKPEAVITPGLGILDLPEVSDKVIEKEQKEVAKPIVSASKFNALSDRVGSLESGLNTVKATLADLPGAIVSGIGSLFSWLQGLLGQILTAIKAIPGALLTGLTALVGGVSSILTGTKDVLLGISDFLINVTKRMLEQLINGVGSINDFLANALSGMFAGLLNGINSMSDLLSGLITNVHSATKTGLKAVSDTLSDVLTNVKAGTLSITGAIASSAANVLAQIKALVIPTTDVQARMAEKNEYLKEAFISKFDFITIPINDLKNIFATPRSLYDVSFEILDTKVYVLPITFKPVIETFRPVANGLIVLLTLFSVYRKFSPEEVVS